MGHDSSEIVSFLNKYIVCIYLKPVGKSIDVFTSPQPYDKLVFLWGMIVIFEDFLDEPFLDMTRLSISNIPSQPGFDLSWLGEFCEKYDKVFHEVIL